MKKVFYLLTIIGLVFTGCNPLEDINNEIDAIPNPVAGTDEITLTSDDYESLVEQGDDEEPDFYETYEAFSDLDDAKAILPDFLSDKYPFWGEGSSVIVNFNLYEGNPGEVSDYVNAEMYEMVADDYPNPLAKAFYPTEDPDDTIPDVLDMQVSNPVAGQIEMVEYKQFTEEPVEGLSPVVEYNFAGSLEGWTVGEEFGTDDVWTSDVNYVVGNSYFGGQVANTEWLVSPTIDLTTESNLIFQITHELDYANDPSLLKIMVSTDYTGDVLTATWDEIILATPASGDMAPSEEYDFSAYDGQTINVAFRYESSDTDAGRWRVESLTIKTPGIEGETLTKSDYYLFDGSSWSKEDDVYYLTTADYDSMGESSGQPGQYNNFDDSVRPENYLPVFLSNKFPYAQEEDKLFVMYRYYEGGGVTNTKGNQYTFMGGEWIHNVSNLKFGFKNGVWEPDNTIRYTLLGDDYNYISSQLINEAGYEGPAANIAQYGSFDVRDSSSNYWDPDMLLVAFDVLLDNLDPSAEEGQKYVLTYKVYDGSVGNREISLIKSEGEWVVNTEEG